MGYFSNAAEGCDYEEKYCRRCVNYRDRNCAVLTAHLVYNYDDCNNEKSILHILIPRSEDGGNEKCAMFLEKGKKEER